MMISPRFPKYIYYYFNYNFEKEERTIEFTFIFQGEFYSHYFKIFAKFGNITDIIPYKMSGTEFEYTKFLENEKSKTKSNFVSFSRYYRYNEDFNFYKNIENIMKNDYRMKVIDLDTILKETNINIKKER